MSNSSESGAALRQLAEAAARAGGAVARQAFGRRQTVRWKADQSEVTDVDVAAQEAVIAALRAQRPHDVFLGEESSAADVAGLTARHTAAGVFWAIDPLDGTRNYVRNIPVFSCSVAALRDGMPAVGAIYDPLQDALYSASSEEGVFFNGQPLAAGAAEADAVTAGQPLLAAIPSTRHGRAQLDLFDRLENVVVRNFGSAALHLAMVATGQLDLTLATECKLWDIAAGWVLLTAAGKRATQPDGQPLFPLAATWVPATDQPILAAAPSIHARLLGRSQ